jgi:hypothetical protein
VSILELAERFPEQHPWGPTVKGLALLRAGRDQEALDAFKRDPEWINGWPARAIAHHRLGQVVLAHEWLDRADQHVREDFDDALVGAGFTASDWFSWWEDWLLRMMWTREAHELIDGKPWPDATWMIQQRARVLARINEEPEFPAAPTLRSTLSLCLGDLSVFREFSRKLGNPNRSRAPEPRSEPLLILRSVRTYRKATTDHLPGMYCAAFR